MFPYSVELTLQSTAKFDVFVAVVSNYIPVITGPSNLHDETWLVLPLQIWVLWIHYQVHLIFKSWYCVNLRKNMYKYVTVIQKKVHLNTVSYISVTIA